MAAKPVYCLVAPIKTFPSSGFYGCSTSRAKAEKALAEMEKRGSTIFGIVKRDSHVKHLKEGFWYGGTRLAGAARRRKRRK